MMTDGLLQVNKPLHITSQKVVYRTRKHFRFRKAGHTGTLDPLASGLMLIVAGEATRFASYLQTQQKAYHAVLQLGIQTSTDDAEGEIESEGSPPVLAPEELLELLAHFQGLQQQEVPRYSAVHWQGRRLYDWARRGIEIPRPSKNIEIFDIRVENYDAITHRISLTIHVSAGTYIRSLARDIGQVLGCGAHLASLHRTSIGKFSEGIPMDAFPDTLDDSPFWVPLESMLDLPIVSVDQAQAEKLAHGQTLDFGIRSDEVQVHFQGKMLGVCKPIDGQLHSKRLRSFPLDWIKNQTQ